jgi:hypothetical protein
LTAIAPQQWLARNDTDLVEVVALASSSGPSAAADPAISVTESDLGDGLLAFSQEL